MFFGDPFTLVVRDDVGAGGRRDLLGIRIPYVREPPRLAAPALDKSPPRFPIE